jgi:hypothetical protein
MRVLDTNMSSEFHFLSDASFEKGFVNRTKELAFLADRATVPGYAVLVTGSRGVGKTTLILMHTHRTEAKYQGGVVRVGFADSGKGVEDAFWAGDAIKGSRLLILDDADPMPATALRRTIERVCDEKRDSLIVLGQKLARFDDPSVFWLHLDGIEVEKLIRGRLDQLPRSATRDRALDFVNANRSFFEGLIQNPRLAVELANKLLVLQGQSSGTREKAEPPWRRFFHVDAVGIVVALALFLLSEHGSKVRLETALGGVRAANARIERVLEDNLDRSYLPHLVASFVNLRREPREDSDNVITILAPGQIVYLKGLQLGWAKVQYLDPTSKAEVLGWVAAAFIKPIQ